MTSLVVTAIVGIVVANGWWAVWQGRVQFWRQRPKRLRFLLLPAPGWALFWLGSTIASMAEQVTDGPSEAAADNSTLGIIGTSIMVVGLVVAAVGTLCALWGCVGPVPRRFDPGWLHVESPSGCRGGVDLDAAWHRSHSARLGLVALVMTAWAGWAVFGSEDGRARVAAALWLLFIGCGAVVLALMTVLDSRQPLPPTIGALPADPEMAGVLFRTDRAGQVGIAAGSCVFAMLGVSMVAAALSGEGQDGDPTLGVYTMPALFIGAVAALIFAPVMVTALAAAALPGGLVLTPDEVIYRAGRAGFRGAWDDLTQVGLRSMAGSLVLCVDGRPESSWRLSGHLRWLAPVNRRLFGADVALSTRVIRVKAATLGALIEYLRASAADRRLLSSPDGLAVLRPTQGDHLGDYRTNT